MYEFAAGKPTEGTDSEPALKQIPNLKNFPNHLGNLGTKSHFAIAEIVTEGNPVGCQICHMSDADDDDIKTTNDFRLATCNLKLKTAFNF